MSSPSTGTSRTANGQAAIEHLRRDPVMAEIIARIGPYTLQPQPATFWLLARSIVFQQLSGKAARTIFDRVELACGGKLTPEALLRLHPNKLRACGLSRQKLAYLRDLARQTRDGKLDFSKLPALNDEEIIATLTEVKGIGVWTAQMFLIFALNRPNVLPCGDLGVQTAIKRAYRKRAKVTPLHVEKIGKSWHPYCSVAAWYLWRSLDGAAEL